MRLNHRILSFALCFLLITRHGDAEQDGSVMVSEELASKVYSPGGCIWSTGYWDCVDGNNAACKWDYGCNPDGGACVGKTCAELSQQSRWGECHLHPECYLAHANTTYMRCMDRADLQYPCYEWTTPTDCSNTWPYCYWDTNVGDQNGVCRSVELLNRCIDCTGTNCTATNGDPNVFYNCSGHDNCTESTCQERSCWYTTCPDPVCESCVGYNCTHKACEGSECPVSDCVGSECWFMNCEIDECTTDTCPTCKDCYNTNCTKNNCTGPGCHTDVCQGDCGDYTCATTSCTESTCPCDGILDDCNDLVKDCIGFNCLNMTCTGNDCAVDYCRNEDCNVMQCDFTFCNTTRVEAYDPSNTICVERRGTQCVTKHRSCSLPRDEWRSSYPACDVLFDCDAAGGCQLNLYDCQGEYIRWVDECYGWDEPDHPQTPLAIEHPYYFTQYCENCLSLSCEQMAIQDCVTNCTANCTECYDSCEASCKASIDTSHCEGAKCAGDECEYYNCTLGTCDARHRWEAFCNVSIDHTLCKELHPKPALNCSEFSHQGETFCNLIGCSWQDETQHCWDPTGPRPCHAFVSQETCLEYSEACYVESNGRCAAIGGGNYPCASMSTEECETYPRDDCYLLPNGKCWTSTAIEDGLFTENCPSWFYTTTTTSTAAPTTQSPDEYCNAVVDPAECDLVFKCNYNQACKTCEPHSCSSASSESDCLRYSSTPSLTVQTGCEWNGQVCYDPSIERECYEVSPDLCDSIEGCVLNTNSANGYDTCERIEGPQLCATWTNDTVCNSEGCSWNTEYLICQNTTSPECPYEPECPSPCVHLSVSGICRYPNPSGECSFIGDATECETVSGCVWNPNTQYCVEEGQCPASSFTTTSTTEVPYTGDDLVQFCNSITTSGQCQNEGCGWDSYCGTCDLHACSTALNESSCYGEWTHRACEWVGDSCVDPRILNACYSYSESTCDGVAHCEWHTNQASLGDICSPVNVTSCYLLAWTGESTCEALNGCRYVGVDCVFESNPQCHYITEENSCLNFTECAWDTATSSCHFASEPVDCHNVHNGTICDSLQHCTWYADWYCGTNDECALSGEFTTPSTSTSTSTTTAESGQSSVVQSATISVGIVAGVLVGVIVVGFLLAVLGRKNKVSINSDGPEKSVELYDL